MQRMEFNLNGKTWLGSKNEGTNIIVDSGTSFILMPYSDLRNLLGILKDQIGLTCS